MSTGKTRADFRYLERLRVRWAEVDMQKIVFNGHYLMYFDTAVAGYWRALALPYDETMEALAGDLFVRKATLEYEGSARYDDLCDVGIRTARIGNSSMLLECALFRGDERLVHGELVYVFADPATRTSRPVPAALREVLLGFEAGVPVLDVRFGAWSELGAEASALRGAVFEGELKLPAALREDAEDRDALQALARNPFGVPVATARLRFQADAVRLSRVAVAAVLRGSGLGTQLVDALLDAARERGATVAELTAHNAAVGFWRRNGFLAVGPPFDEGGVPHQRMRRTL
jgi:YbgC/YbaW family acyl-CoA thioester hydrolase